jgi:integrase
MAVKWEKTLNNFNSLPERQDEARRVLDQVLADLKVGFNSITSNTTLPSTEGDDPALIPTHDFLSLSTTFSKALEWSFDQFPQNHTKADMQTCMFLFQPALVITKLDNLPIKEVSPQQILVLLSAASKVNSRYDAKLKKQVALKWTDYKHNKSLAYLSMLLNKVLELRIIPVNPCHGLLKKTTLTTPQKPLMPYELAAIDEKLQSNPNFRRFIMIFHSSGSRITELMKVQAKDVLLNQNCFYRWILKKKTKKNIQQRTTIPTNAIHLWKEQLSLCSSPDDFLFTIGFRPREKKMGVGPVNRYSKRLVQVPLGIVAGPYQLKHEYLTQLKKMHGSQTAASHAGHSSTQMIDVIYDLDKEDTEHERIRTANISPLSPDSAWHRLKSACQCPFQYLRFKY